MNHYNRTNPFLYILDQSNDALILETQNLIKLAIIQFILSTLCVVEEFFFCFLIKKISYFEVFILFICIFSNWFVANRVIVAISHNKQLYINRKKYPDSDLATYVTLNNEEMFNDTINVNIHLGQVKGFKNSIFLIFGIILISVIIYCIRILMILL